MINAFVFTDDEDRQPAFVILPDNAEEKRAIYERMQPLVRSYGHVREVPVVRTLDEYKAMIRKRWENL
jgi:hypothetical protein